MAHPQETKKEREVLGGGTSGVMSLSCMSKETEIERGNA
jgi:hypothetical protein